MPPTPHFFTRMKILKNWGSSNQDQLGSIYSLQLGLVGTLAPPPHFQIPNLRSDGPAMVTFQIDNNDMMMMMMVLSYWVFQIKTDWKWNYLYSGADPRICEGSSKRQVRSPKFSNWQAPQKTKNKTSDVLAPTWVVSSWIVKWLLMQQLWRNNCHRYRQAIGLIGNLAISHLWALQPSKICLTSIWTSPGHSRSKQTSQNERPYLYMTSYPSSIVTLWLSWMDLEI